MATYDLKNADDVKEYLKNLHIEYKFGCYSEKNPEACHLLGDYEESITQDLKKAAELYKTNCDVRNYPRSCAKYGNFSVIGRGCDKNIVDGYKYMKKGCELNDARGCYHAGVVAIGEEKVEEDRATQVANGMKMLEKACDSNQTDACFHLSGIYLVGIEGYVKKNLKESYNLFVRCCNEGNPYACANLSLMYKNGDGVKQDMEKSATYRQRANTLFEEFEKQTRQLKFQEGISS